MTINAVATVRRGIRAAQAIASPRALALGALAGGMSALAGAGLVSATPPGTADVNTESGAPTGSLVGVFPSQWVAAEFTVGSGTQITGLELALVENNHPDWEHRDRRHGSPRSDVFVSLWSATSAGLPGNEMVSSPVTVLNQRGCWDRRFTEVDLYTPPAVKPGERLFVVLGVLGGSREGGDGQANGNLAWCEYRGSTPQVVALSRNQGSTWASSDPPAGGTVSPQLGFTDYVTDGPPAVTPETPITTLLPVAGAGTMGGAAILARRRRTRRSFDHV